MTDKNVREALRCCAEGECKDCAMHEDKQRCQENLLDKAAEAIERLTAERDAALADLADARSCKTCKYACDTRDCSSCKSKTCKCRECHLDKNAWEWRGLPEAPAEGGKA